MIPKEISLARAAEKAAKDAFYAAGAKATVELYNAMVAATKARQEAMTAYAASL